jgi:hypothetical protein
MCLQYCSFEATMLTSCDNAVPTTWQQLVTMLFKQHVNNRFVASLLTSCDNAVPTTCQQDFSQQLSSKLVSKL